MASTNESAAFTPGVVYVPVPRCDQCRWWGGPGDLYGTGDCGHARDLMTRDGEPSPDASGGVWTSPDFGCVQFEAKYEGHRRPGREGIMAIDSIETRAAFEAGFAAGFASTREGFNGECVFDHLAPILDGVDGDNPRPGLCAAAARAYAEGPEAFERFMDAVCQ
jgi:hypothetical protein